LTWTWARCAPCSPRAAAVAGIGNVYSDEILFHARLDPRRPAAGLSDQELRRLHRQLHRVLRRAIAGDAQPDRMPRGWLLHAREDGAACPRGNGVVRGYDASGRHAYWCPSCQS
jgi:formamidopyrimidine-DNA glycosylase